MLCVVHAEPAPSILRCGALALHHYELLPAVAVAGPGAEPRSVSAGAGAGAATVSLCGCGYVVMPEHVHLLISEPQHGDPSAVMKALKQGFARRLLSRLRRVLDSKQMPLWQAP